MDILRSIGKQSGEPVESVLTKKRRLQWKGLGEKEGLSLEWKSEGVMDDERGESIEPMKVTVPLIGLDEGELERLVCGWQREAGSWFQRRGGHTGRNDLLFLEWMM